MRLSNVWLSSAISYRSTRLVYQKYLKIPFVDSAYQIKLLQSNVIDEEKHVETAGRQDDGVNRENTGEVRRPE